MECAWWRSENAKWTGNATNGNMIVCLHMIHLYIPFRGAGAGARAPAVAEKTYDILYLPTPFICGAINNIEINYRLKLTVINHFIFIISSSFRYCRLLSRVGVYVCRCVPPNDKRRNSISCDICVLRALHRECYWKTLPRLLPHSASSCNNVINVSLPGVFCGDADVVLCPTIATAAAHAWYAIYQMWRMN